MAAVYRHIYIRIAKTIDRLGIALSVDNIIGQALITTISRVSLTHWIALGYCNNQMVPTVYS